VVEEEVLIKSLVDFLEKINIVFRWISWYYSS
jgi:hypothetical protein